MGVFIVHLQHGERKKTAKIFRVYKPVEAERSKHAPVDRIDR